MKVVCNIDMTFNTIGFACGCFTILLYTVAFLIPGVSALMQIVLTFYFRLPNQTFSYSKQQNVLIGQVVLALRDTEEFLKTHQYVNQISKKITVIKVYYLFDLQ